MSEWISVNDRLPDERFVLVTLNCYPAVVMESEFWADKFHRIGGDMGEISCVSHWMPLPKPAKESK